MRETNGDTQGSTARVLAALCTVCVLHVVSACTASAQKISGLHDFNGTDGADPVAGLVQATDGNLYGTTFEGGANNDKSVCYLQNAGCGTVFKITPAGKLTTLYSFCAQPNCTDGANPESALIQAGDGNLYGTTLVGGNSGGGTTGDGTIFRLTLDGTLTTLYKFCSEPNCADGALPTAGLIQATDGSLYGTTEGGQLYNICNPSSFPCGTVFKITLSGEFTNLYTFCSQADCADGANPFGGLIQAADGNFYGTTAGGGANFNACNTYGCGTVFKITPGGTFTTLYNFCSEASCSDGSEPLGGLVQATNGAFYGTTFQGGNPNGCRCGTAFRITSQGVLTTLHGFTGESDGYDPEAGLIQGTDGNFYGTTTYGTTSDGTVFKMTPNGTVSGFTLGRAANGTVPVAPLAQDTSGNFYGTASMGGTNEDGTIFTLSMGLGPFVKTEPTSAKVGKPINILGTALKGATIVTFNGVAATFTVVSSSLITTTVPQGATTGKVKVVSPSGTFTSNVNFRVLP